MEKQTMKKQTKCIYLFFRFSPNKQTNHWKKKNNSQINQQALLQIDQQINRQKELTNRRTNKQTTR